MGYISFTLLTFFITAYSIILWQYTPSYRNRYSFADYNLHNFPDNYNCYNWRGLMYKDQNRRHEALGMWLDGLKYRSNDFRLLFNIASLLGELGRLEDSYKFFEMTKKSAIPDMLEQKIMGLINQRQDVLKKAMADNEKHKKAFIVNEAKKLKEKNNG